MSTGIELRWYNGALQMRNTELDYSKGIFWGPWTEVPVVNDSPATAEPLAAQQGEPKA